MQRTFSLLALALAMAMTCPDPLPADEGLWLYHPTRP